jgi:hypothetical protein
MHKYLNLFGTLVKKCFIALVPAAFTIKRLTVSQQNGVFATAIHFYPSLILASKAGAYQSEALWDFTTHNGRLLALPTNIRLGWN